MRDFNNIDLIGKIEKCPRDYIVHRKVNLLNAFELGYCILTKIENLEQLKKKYESMPSMNEYAWKKYKYKYKNISIDEYMKKYKNTDGPMEEYIQNFFLEGNNIDPKSFSSILEYISESELEYFNSYLQFINEYESKYLLEEKIEYIVEPQFKLKKILHDMRKRYALYFGQCDLESFRAFFDGYINCKRDNNLDIDVFESKIINFLKSIECTLIEEMNEKNITWDRKYAYNRFYSISLAYKNPDLIDCFFNDLEKKIGEEI